MDTSYMRCSPAGSAAVAQPLINLTAVSVGANAALGRVLCCPAFSYAANDLAGLVTAFLFEDVGVTAYNGAAPLVSDKGFLGDVIAIGSVEAYHAGIVSLATACLLACTLILPVAYCIAVRCDASELLICLVALLMQQLLAVTSMQF